MNLLIGACDGEWLSHMRSVLQTGTTCSITNDQESFWRELARPLSMIVVHVELFAERYPWDWVVKLRERQPDAQVIIVSSDAIYDSLMQEVLQRWAAAAGMKVVPSEASGDEIIEIMFPVTGKADFRSTDEGLLVTIWSASAKDGATTVATNMAFLLARHTPLKIGLFDLNLKNPELRLIFPHSDRARSNMMLRPKLQTGQLRPTELWDACVSWKGVTHLRILHGTHRRDTAADFSPQMMEALLQAARQTFDITLLDVSTYPDNAATICAVRAADIRWLVAQQHIGSYLWSWSEWYECYWRLCGLKADQVHAIMNRYDPQGQRAERIAAAMGMPLAGTIPDASALIKQRTVHRERILLAELEHKDMVSALHRLASKLALQASGKPLMDAVRPRRKPLVSLLTGIY
jgi:pilus assembly protein CpaE